MTQVLRSTNGSFITGSTQRGTTRTFSNRPMNGTATSGVQAVPMFGPITGISTSSSSSASLPVSSSEATTSSSPSPFHSSSGSTSSSSNSRNMILFTEQNKMSLNLVEFRIDYHLNRVMKSYRLTNFSNAIKSLPVHARICEKILEILTSSESMIGRKLGHLKDAKEILAELSEILQALPIIPDNESKDQLSNKWTRVKTVAMNTEQLMWALNSNKEHLKYVARVFVIPDQYKRTDDELIPIKEQFTRIIRECEEIIEMCKSIRSALGTQLKTIYSCVNIPALN